MEDREARISLPHAFVYEFAWSPDGSRLVYTAFDPAGVGQKELFIVSVDGGAPRRLTYRPQNDMEPAWSPDGRWIAYTREVYHYGADFHITHEIWAIRPDRSEVRQLTTGENDTSADWAPDGSRVAFSHVGLDGGIHAVDPDCTDLAQIVPADWAGHAPPSFSPDGGHLVYGASATDAELTVVTAAGALVATIGAGRRPDWQPIPEFPLVDEHPMVAPIGVHGVHGRPAQEREHRPARRPGRGARARPEDQVPPSGSITWIR